MKHWYGKKSWKPIFTVKLKGCTHFSVGSLVNPVKEFHCIILKNRQYRRGNSKADDRKLKRLFLTGCSCKKCCSGSSWSSVLAFLAGGSPESCSLCGAGGGTGGGSSCWGGAGGAKPGKPPIGTIGESLNYIIHVNGNGWWNSDKTEYWRTGTNN